jgi:hypothetical protein
MAKSVLLRNNNTQPKVIWVTRAHDFTQTNLTELLERPYSESRLMKIDITSDENDESSIFESVDITDIESFVQLAKKYPPYWAYYLA